MTRTTIALLSSLLLTMGTASEAGVSISPFVSINSTKSIKPAGSGTEKTTNKQRTTYGIRGKISFWRLMGLQASIGTNKLATTEKTSEIKDEFDEIDLNKELDISQDDPEQEVKITEEQRRAQVNLVIDPSFSIFILRAKAGVQATQRLFTREQEGMEKETFEGPITYKPVAGAGAGVRLGRKAFFIAEYNFLFYKFPEYEPFEREVAITAGINL